MIYLIMIKNYILNFFSNGQPIDVVYTDFEKAFDRVNHELLIHKLRKIEFSNHFLSWTNSFLYKKNQLPN